MSYFKFFIFTVFDIIKLNMFCVVFLSVAVFCGSLAQNTVLGASWHDTRSFVIHGSIKNFDDPENLLIDIPLRITAKKRSGEGFSWEPKVTIKEKIAWYSLDVGEIYRGRDIHFDILDPLYAFYKNPVSIELDRVARYEVSLLLRYSKRHPEYGLNEAIEINQNNLASIEDISRAIDNVNRINYNNARFQTLALHALLLKKLLKKGELLNDQDFESIFLMDEENLGFKELNGARKFRIYSDVAIALGHARDLHERIESGGLTYYDAAIYFNEKAIESSFIDDGSKTNEQYIVQSYARKYSLHQQGDELYRGIDTIRSFLGHHGEGAAGGFIRRFFEDWWGMLQKLSAQEGGEEESQEAFRARIAADKNLKDLWIEYSTEAEKIIYNKHWRAKKYTELKLAQKKSLNLIESINKEK